MVWRIGAVALVLVVGVVLWREQTPAPRREPFGVDVEGAEDHLAAIRRMRPFASTAPIDPTPGEVVFQHRWVGPRGDERIVILDHEHRVVLAPRECELEAADLRSLVLSARGALRLGNLVVGAVEAADEPARSPSDGDPWASFTLGTFAYVTLVLEGSPVPAPPPTSRPVTLAEATAALADLGWLGDEVTTPEGPWVPASIEVVVARAAGSRGEPPVPWPPTVPAPDVPRPGDAVPIGFEGDDVATVLALFDEPHPEVLLEGEVVSLTLDVVLPGTSADAWGC